MQFGRSYEEFEVGATYKHWPGKTVTEFDDHMFCLLTMNHHPLHLDTHYAGETTQFGKNVVVGNYVYSILLGMSVADISCITESKSAPRVACSSCDNAWCSATKSLVGCPHGCGLEWMRMTYFMVAAPWSGVDGRAALSPP